MTSLTHYRYCALELHKINSNIEKQNTNTSQEKSFPSRERDDTSARFIHDL